MSESNVELARRGYAAVLRGDVETLRTLLDPDITWHGGDPAAPFACHNREEALAFMSRVRSRGERGEPVEFIDAGDRVVVIMRRMADDGKSSELVANLTTFRDGKVVEMVHYPNPADARAAAGLPPRSRPRGVAAGAQVL